MAILTLLAWYAFLGAIALVVGALVRTAITSMHSIITVRLGRTSRLRR